MKRGVHTFASMGALGLIATFFSATVAVELFGSYDAVAVVKRSIWYGIFVLIPLMAVAGITGNLLAKGKDNPLINEKKRRMPLIALNGIVVLIPAAYWLDTLASRGEFTSLFYLIQGVELFFGGLNIFLMSRSVIGGKKLAKNL